jgi:hypothetical protein
MMPAAVTSQDEVEDRVLASRCFTSSISESEIETVNGRTRVEVGGVGAVTNTRMM